MSISVYSISDIPRAIVLGHWLEQHVYGTLHENLPMLLSCDCTAERRRDGSMDRRYLSFDECQRQGVL